VDAWFAFALGLVGSLHCVQMCGPLVLGAGLPLADRPRGRQLLAHACYNLGRITTYTLLGAAAGVVGSAVTVLGRLAGVRHAALFAGGVLLIATAASMVGLRSTRGATVGLFRHASAWSRFVARLMQSDAVSTRFVMGLVLGLLPCGLVYGALVKAAATASVVGGVVTMAAFGAGTSGALLAVGLCVAPLGRFAGRWSTRTAAFAMAAMGIVLVWRAGLR